MKIEVYECDGCSAQTTEPRRTGWKGCSKKLEDQGAGVFFTVYAQVPLWREGSGVGHYCGDKCLMDHISQLLTQITKRASE